MFLGWKYAATNSCQLRGKIADALYVEESDGRNSSCPWRLTLHLKSSKMSNATSHAVPVNIRSSPNRRPVKTIRAGTMPRASEAMHPKTARGVLVRPRLAPVS